MSSVLSTSERAAVRATTYIDPFIIDRTCDAFDALLRDDREGFLRHMTTATVQMGLPLPEKPHAVDRMKFIILGVLSKRWRCSYRKASERVARMLDA